jgi:hypothetical protein
MGAHVRHLHKHATLRRTAVPMAQLQISTMPMGAYAHARMVGVAAPAPHLQHATLRWTAVDMARLRTKTEPMVVIAHARHLRRDCLPAATARYLRHATLLRTAPMVAQPQTWI